ncbi:SMI1/KNR4 family protein [Moraxella atlantae]|nr:SMI1/KNR4 family protein [Moraxella atlantae]OPH36789.1 hypothetical protein B5J92_02625 [Moraxella atlantae]
MTSNLNLSDVSPLSQETITDLESKLDHKIPKEYSNFLINYNGAKLKNKVIKDDLGYTNISELFDYQHLIKNLMNYYDDKNIQKLHMLPIASDVFGNLFCISMDEKRIGLIFFYDHETGCFSKLFNSFSEFINNFISDDTYKVKIMGEDMEFEKRLEELRKNSKFKLS